MLFKALAAQFIVETAYEVIALVATHHNGVSILAAMLPVAQTIPASIAGGQDNIALVAVDFIVWDWIHNITSTQL